MGGTEKNQRKLDYSSQLLDEMGVRHTALRLNEVKGTLLLKRENYYLGNLV